MVSVGIKMVAQIFGMGILLAVIDILLRKAGKEEVAFWVSLAGLVAIMFIVLPTVGKLFEEVQSIFHIF
jgi:stage III sporulation protein AC